MTRQKQCFILTFDSWASQEMFKVSKSELFSETTAQKPEQSSWVSLSCFSLDLQTGPLSGLRQFLTTERKPFKNFEKWFLFHVNQVKVNFKIYEITG